MSKKVAFIQNRLQFGGRFQVVVHMIKVLNRLGISPDFLCFASRFTVDDARKRYGSDLNFTIKTIGINYKVPFEWNILLFNKIVSKHVANYDLVLNHNNTSFFYSAKLPTISYVHFPRKARLLAEEKSIHFPEGKKSSLFDIATDALKLAHFSYKTNTTILENDKQVANSIFTKEALLKAYPSFNGEVEVIYPPVEKVALQEREKKPNLVVSLGRFSPDKRQMEQIEIASKCPNLEFVLMGFINSKAYFEQCQERIEHLNLKNIKLLGDAPKEEVNAILASATFFLHNLRNEPFGITAVQGIQAGCIPIVHNSGGQKEVVPNDALRYNSLDEAVSILQHLAKMAGGEKELMLQKLADNCKRFEATTFEESFKQLISPYL